MKDCIIHRQGRHSSAVCALPKSVSRSRWNMLIRCAHRNKERHYTQPRFRYWMCSCLGFADGRFCVLMSAGIHKATAPLPGGSQKWRRSWPYWPVTTLNTIVLYFCHQRTEAKKLHSWGWRAEAETGAQCQTHIRYFHAKLLIFPFFLWRRVIGD